jgi:hypothetical protein
MSTIFFIGKPEGKIPLRSVTRSEMGLEGADWIHLAQDGGIL